MRVLYSALAFVVFVPVVLPGVINTLWYEYKHIYFTDVVTCRVSNREKAYLGLVQTQSKSKIEMKKTGR